MTTRVLIVLIAATMTIADLTDQAQAVVGRPLTPVSYAGVARRTARRTTRRTVAATTTVAVLPTGCVFAGGIYTCGTVRYQPYYDGPTVVYQVIE